MSIDHSEKGLPGRKHPRSRRRLHHSPLFWVGVVLFLTAITIYLASDDLVWRPH